MIKLSQRELEVAKLVASGKMRKEAAFELNIAIHTVDTHLRNAYIKLGVGNRVQLVRSLMDLGVL